MAWEKEPWRIKTIPESSLALGVEAYDASSIPVAISAIDSDLATDLATIL